ncbi:hypothetical protein [Oceanobacillus sp. CAU 1775]
MSEIGMNDLMLAIKELGEKVNTVIQEQEEMKQEISTFRNETNLNFRKLEKKISILTKDVFDVRTDMLILEEKVK